MQNLAKDLMSYEFFKVRNVKLRKMHKCTKDRQSTDEYRYGGINVISKSRNNDGWCFLDLAGHGFLVCRYLLVFFVEATQQGYKKHA